jgi:prepilin-type N-terminal cleavage/methylation domain-containing protein
MRKGFTLIELAVVLVIIGLVAGGIMMGAGMVDQSKQKRLVQQINELRIATQSFIDIYKAVPGDTLNATSLWGTAAACPQGGTPGTCNGNGDGRINLTTEINLFPQHLGYAKLVAHNYNSDWTSAMTIGVQTFETPYSGISIQGTSLAYRLSGHAWFYDGEYGNFFRVGRPNFPACPTCFNNWIRCKEIAAIDKKFDDNKPGTGIIRISKAECVTDTAATATFTAEYDPTQAVNAVPIFMWENSM